jgi:hypothetical protein
MLCKLICPTVTVQAEMPVNKGFKENNRMTAKLIFNVDPGLFLNV